MKKKMPRWKKRLYRDGIVVGLLALIAVGLLGEIARQDWHTKVTAYPTKTETAIETRAQQILNKMTLEEKVGQMFMVRCPEENQVEAIEQYHLGGFTLYTNDFEGKTKNDVAAAVDSYQAASSIPMLIGVDEEGGKVNRISTYTAFRGSAFLSARELYATGGMTLVENDTVEKCQLLKSLGINMNYAPVADVTTNPNGYMYDRALGANAVGTGRYVKNVVTVMNDQRVISVLKHFPGYGNVTADTHTGMAVDNRPIEDFLNSDFLPFKDGIEAEAPVILVGHNIVTAIDPDRPASLSEEVHKVLRRELGFEGVVITDELRMEGVRQYTDDEQLAVEAVLAGNDLICTTDYETQIPAVLKAVKAGAISEERIDESVLRILKLKIQFNMI